MEHVEQLYKKCLPVVGEIVKNLTTEQCGEIILDLPRNICQDIAFYTSPKKLYDLRNILEQNQINTTEIWKFHYSKRWSYKHQSTPVVFKSVTCTEGDVTENYQYLYLEKHFQDVLQSMCFPKSSQSSQLNRGICYMLTSQYNHHINKTVQEVPEDIKVALTQLSTWTPFVRKLIILSSQSCHLLTPSVLSEMKLHLRRLAVHMLQEKHLENTVSLVSSLLHNGKLEELNLFNPRIDVTTFGYFVHVCAGHVPPMQSDTKPVAINDTRNGINTTKNCASDFDINEESCSIACHDDHSSREELCNPACTNKVESLHAFKETDNNLDIKDLRSVNVGCVSVHNDLVSKTKCQKEQNDGQIWKSSETQVTNSQIEFDESKSTNGYLHDPDVEQASMIIKFDTEESSDNNEGSSSGEYEEDIYDDFNSSDDSIVVLSESGSSDNVDHVDLFDIALHREFGAYFSQLGTNQVFQRVETFSVKDCPCIKQLNNVDHRKGLKAFSLEGILERNSMEEPSTSDILNEVIPLWPKLEAMSFSGFSLKDLFISGTILRSTEPPGHVQEIVLDNTVFLDSTNSDVLCGLVSDQTRKGPMKRVKLSNIYKEIYVSSSDIKEIPQDLEGFIEFEMMNVELSPRALKYVACIISRDKALQHLHLGWLNTISSQQVVKLFQSIQMRDLQTLELSDFNMQTNAIENEFCKILLSLPKLRKLILIENVFSPSFILSPAFLTALRKSPNLFHLDLSHSLIHEKGEEFLGEILCPSVTDDDVSQTSIRSINLSYTRCCGKRLMEKGQWLLQHKDNVTHLKRLNLSGNNLKKSEKEVITIWRNFAKEVVALSENYDIPFAEHLSQM